MADLRAKALACLRDGRVTVTKAHGAYGGAPGPQRVEAKVASSRPEHPAHVVDRWDGGEWSCTCPAHARSGLPCPHIAAVQLVTGWPSDARREQEVPSA